MIKKKISILLLLLLAVLFIGSFSTSYARNVTLTESDIDKVIEYYVSGTTVINSYKEKLHLKLQAVYDNFDSCTIVVDNNVNAYVTITLYGYNRNEVVSISNNKNLNYMSLSMASNSKHMYTGWQYNLNGGNNIYQNNLTGSITFGTGSHLRTTYLCVSTDLGNNLFTGPWESTDIIWAEKFVFSPTSTNFDICSIQGLTTPSQVYVYDRSNGHILTIGYLEQFSFLDNITVLRYRYSKTNGWFETSSYATDNFNGYNVQDDILTYTIDIDNISSDTLVLFSFQPNDEQFVNQDFWLYIKSSNTVINNGVIIPDDTFTDNYYNNYNNDTNTDKIVDNNTNDTDKITDTLTDDSQVDNILGNNFSGDNLLNNIGYNPIANPFSTIILNTMTNFTDALLGSGSQTLSFTIFNNTITISSDDFALPNGELRNFISLICNGFLVYEICKYGFKLYQWINTGRIQNLVNEANNHQYYLF